MDKRFVDLLCAETVSGRLIRFGFILVAMFILLVVAIAATANENNSGGPFFDDFEDYQEPQTNETVLIPGTLGDVYERGVLRCGIRQENGRSALNPDTNEWEGFSVDMVRV